MLFALDGNGTLTEQLYRSVRDEILSARLAAGTRLPSSRQISSEVGVSRNVVVLAYERLLGEGYLTARRGAGHFVAAGMPSVSEAAGRGRPTASVGRGNRLPRLARHARAALDSAAETALVWRGASRTPLCDFRYGGPSFGDFPHATWCRILARRARRATLRDLDYGTPEGLPALREAIADYLRRARGVVCDAEQVLVVNGSQQAIDLVARTLLDPGDHVVLEEPHYRPARVVFDAAGAEVRTVAVDDDGLRVDDLPSAHRVRLVYVTPSHQFPTGVMMPLARRLQLLAWAEQQEAWLFEDDYDSEFRYGGAPLASLQGLDRGGRVLYAGSFSKVMFPALRLGYLVVPEQLVGAVRVVKSLADAGSALLAQLTLAEFIRDGHFERHIRRTRARNAARRATLLAALDRHLGDRVEVVGANAGLHVLIWLRGLPFARTAALRREASAAGVRVYSVAPFFLTPPKRAGLLLGFSALTEREIADGIKRLAPVVRRAVVEKGT